MRYSQLDEDTFFFDERAEYLARVDQCVAGKLEAAVPPDGSLSAALSRLAQQPVRPPAAAEDSTDTVVRLPCFGVRVDVRCTYRRCAEAIGSFYSASLASPGFEPRGHRVVRRAESWPVPVPITARGPDRRAIGRRLGADAAVT